MNNDKVIKKVLGNGGTPSNRAFKDSDGDGVMNVYDCQPYNKHKQGIIHDAKEAVKRKIAGYKAERQVKKDVGEQVDSGQISNEKDVRSKYTRGSVGERAALKRIEQREIEEATRKEDFKQRKSKAVANVRQRYNQKQSGSSGLAGLSNALVGGGNSPGSMGGLLGGNSQPQRKTIRVPVRKKSRKGKKRKFVSRTVAVKPKQPGIYGLRL